MSPPSIRLMLVGFDRKIYEEFCRQGLRPVIWVRPGAGNSIHKENGTWVYEHSMLKKAQVKPIFRKSLSPETQQIVFEKSYPLFLRNLNKDTRCAFLYGTSWADKTNRLNTMIHYFHDLLKRNEVTHVIFCSPPHGGANISLYFLSREMGIKTLMMMQSPFENRHFIFETLEDIGWFKTSRKGAIDPEIVPRKRPEAPFYMNADIPGHYNPRDGFLRTSKRMATAMLGITWHGLRRMLGLSHKLPARMRAFCTGRDRMKMLWRWRGMQFDSSLLNKSYIYFPLHFQPELSCETLGGDYADQLRAIEELRRKVPEDVAILVKENPLQSAFAREDSFFARLGAIPNTHYVLPHVDTFLLIERSIAVATLLGTAGWEALQMGKPAICFGYAWYRSLPGVFNWPEEFDWHAIENFTCDWHKLELAVQELSRVVRKGVPVPKFFKQIVSDFSEEENARLLVQSVREHL